MILFINLLGEANVTIITLVQKVPNSSRITKFRSITNSGPTDSKCFSDPLKLDWILISMMISYKLLS